MIAATALPRFTRPVTAARVDASISASMARSNALDAVAVWAMAGADRTERLRASGVAQARAKRVNVIGWSFHGGERKRAVSAVPWPGRRDRSTDAAEPANRTLDSLCGR